MKIKLFVIVSLAIAIWACDKNNSEDGDSKKFVMKGKLNYSSTDTLFLQQIIGNNIKSVDSVVLTGKSEFEITGNLSEAGFFRLELSQGAVAVFVMDETPVNVNIEQKEDDIQINVKGGSLNDDFEYFAQIQRKFQSKSDSLNQLYILAENTKDDEKIKLLESAYTEHREILKSNIKQAVKERQKSFVSIFAVSNLDANEDFPFLDTLANDLRSQISENEIVKNYIASIDKIKAIAIGSSAPSFEGNTPDGRIVKLSDYKGKVVLIDFWASWCVPCRKANPEIVKIYEKYKDKNFDILGVSLDNNVEKWKNAIKDDNLTWQHISDLKGWDSDFAVLYNVESIPQGFLLDAEGKIIAKNLDPEALDAKLAEIFKVQ